jgi:hypothetical protein
MANNILAKMSVLISANTAAFNANLRQSQNQFERFTSTLNKGANAIGLAFGSVAAYNGLKYGVGVIAEFEQKMSEVQAITGASGKALEKLKNNAKDLGAATKFTAAEVAELQIAYGRLGFTDKEILQVTKATLDLATATGEDLAKSADIAGSTLRGFGLDADQMQRVIDVMASSFNKSALGLENFSEAMKYVAPVAAANNISLEETTALLGTLADNGIRGSMAGTSLRKIISDLDKGTKPLNEKLKDLAAKGFNSADAMDEVGRTAYASLLTLVKYNDKTSELTKSLGDVNGEASKMASIMEDNLIGDFTKLTSAIDGLILSAEGASAPLREVTQDLTRLVNFIKDSGAAKGIADVFKAQVKLGTLIPRLFDDTNESANGAQTTWEEVAKKVEQVAVVTKKEIINLDWVQERIKKVNEEFEATSITDTGRLRMLAMEKARLENIAKQIKSIMSGASKDLDTTLPSTKADLFDEKSWYQGVLDRMKTIKGPLVQTAKEIETAYLDMSSAIAGSISSVANDIGEALGGNDKIKFGDSILKALAGFAKSVGETLIGIGTAMLVARQMIKNPVTAIAAGVALVALAGALNASLSKAQSNFNSGSSSSNGASRTSGSVFNSDGQRIQFDAKFILKGDDLVAIVDRTNRQNGRLRG